MHKRIVILFFVIGFISCNNAGDGKLENDEEATAGQMKFDEAKWKAQEGEDYPYRENMLDDVIYNDTLRALDKDQILDVLGAPNRVNENYLYYTISRKRLGSWTLHAKTMVIKFDADDSIEWIKIHE